MAGKRPPQILKLLKNPRKQMLKIANLEVVYNEVVLVLRGLSIEVPEGDIVALLGSNGAGKTTTTRAITGLLDVHEGKVTKGSVTFNGEQIDNKNPSTIVRSGISQVLEGRRIFAELTVDENLTAGAITSKDKAAIKTAHERVMTMFPVLAERRKSIAGYLSGGEQQMLAIGRALMAKPKIILMDEPSMGLSPMLVKEVFDIIRKLNKELGITILLVEQNAKLALNLSSRSYIMENGKIVMEGKSEDLIENEDVKEFYLGISGEGRQSFKDVKQYRRRKRWL